jgi:hypothetical protein
VIGARIPRPSATGARVFGDDMQFLVVLDWALKAIRPDEGIVSIEVEAENVHTVDDVVVMRLVPPHEFQQVKASTDAREPLGTAYLVEPRGRRRRSILRGFHEEWKRLGSAGLRPRLALVSTRQIDPSDALLRRLDRDELLAAAVRRANPASLELEVAHVWAEHLQISIEELTALLEDMRFVLRGSEASWLDQVRLRLQLAGLERTDAAIAQGLQMVREWVKDGRRSLTCDEIVAEVDKLDIAAGPATAILIVDAVERTDSLAAPATVRLDWVDHFEGATPTERIRLRDVGLWDGQLAEELQAAALQIRRLGYQRVLVDGNMRLPTWFAVGAQLREVVGWTVAAERHGLSWDSRHVERQSNWNPDIQTLGHGDDVAIVVAVTAALSDEVNAYISGTGLPVRAVWKFVAPGGAHSQAITSGVHGAGLARELRMAVQSLCGLHRPQRIHLFLSAPGGFALLLGHYWDRLPSTQTYDWLGPGRGYSPAFLVR